MKKLLILLLIFPVTAVFSQSNFKEGYLITLTNDTVYGLIDFRTDYTNAEVCRFMKSPDAAVEAYLPGSIAGYRFVAEGKYYVSKKVVFENLNQTYFLEFLLQGLKNLYYLPFDKGIFFFEDKDGNMVGITRRPDQIIENYKLKVDNRYKGVMSYLFRDCMPLATETSRVGFDKASMIQFSREYHDRVCDTGESCIIFEHNYKRSFIQLDFTFFGGAELVNVKLTDINFPAMSSLSPYIGAGIQLSSPRFLKMLHYTLEGSLSALSVRSEHNVYFLGQYVFGYQSIIGRLNTGFEYIHDKGRIRPALGAGLNAQILISPERTYTKDNVYLQTGPFMHSGLLGPAASVGVDVPLNDRTALSLRLLYAHQQSVFLKINTLQLRAGLRLL